MLHTSSHCFGDVRDVFEDVVEYNHVKLLRSFHAIGKIAVTNVQSGFPSLVDDIRVGLDPGDLKATRCGIFEKESKA